MEIKRVIAGGLATLAAGATLALGVGAVTLGDFVKVSGNTMTSPYIVIGGNAKAEDTLAAADVAVALAGQATQSVAVSGSQASMGVSDGALLEVTSRKLYINDQFNNADIKPTFLAKDLPVLLASGTVKQKDNEEVDYSQYLKLGGQKVTFGRDTSWDDPALYIDLVKNENLYTYELIFSQGLDTAEIANKEINILGIPFVFSDTTGDLGGEILTLFGAGQTETITAGASTTVTVGGEDYVITVVGVGDSGDAVLDINGETFDVDTSDSSTLDITKGDLAVHVKAVRALKYPVEAGSVQLFIGSEKTVLYETAGVAQKVKIGDSDVDGTSVSIDNTTTKIDKVTITYAVQDKQKLLSGESVTDPVFGAFKIAFGGIYPALDDSSKDMVKIESNDDTADLTFTNKDGDLYEMTVLYLNDTAGGIDLSDGNYNLRVYNNATLTEGDFVVVTTGEYSYILEFTDYTSDDEVVLSDVSTGTDYTISANTQYIYPGESGRAVTVTAFAPGGEEAVALNNTGGANYALATIYTEHGAEIQLVATNATDDGPLVDFTDTVTLTEHTFKTTDDVAEATVTIALTNDTSKIDEISVSSPSLTPDESGDYKYGVTTAGTYIIEDVDNEVVTMYTPEEPNAVYVAVGSDPMFTAGEGSSSGTIKQAVQIKNSISKLESEVDTSSSVDPVLTAL